MTLTTRELVAELTPEAITIVDLLHRRGPLTRLDLTSRLGMGRNAVAAHLREALDTGIIIDNGRIASTGGRAPQTWAFDPSAGRILTAIVEVEAMHLAVTDLNGRVLISASREWRIQEGPTATLEEIVHGLHELIDEGAPIWGIGVSVPGPVDHSSGRPSAPPIMPGWDDFDIPARLGEALGVPVFVDNDVNVMALGHCDPGSSESLVFVYVSKGIGAGLVSHGRLHRGAKGAAGDIGHTRIPQSGTTVCRCGRIGCLEASAGGWAQELLAAQIAASGVSPYLSEVLDKEHAVTAEAIAEGAAQADPSCIRFVATSASAIGDVVAVLVSFFNPDRLVFSGPLPTRAPLFLETITRVIHEQTLSLAAESVKIEISPCALTDSIRGCARMVLDSVLAPVPQPS